MVFLLENRKTRLTKIIFELVEMLWGSIGRFSFSYVHDFFSFKNMQYYKNKNKLKKNTKNIHGFLIRTNFIRTCMASNDQKEKYIVNFKCLVLNIGKIKEHVKNILSL